MYSTFVVTMYKIPCNFEHQVVLVLGMICYGDKTVVNTISNSVISYCLREVIHLDIQNPMLYTHVHHEYTHLNMFTFFLEQENKHFATIGPS